MALNPIIKFTTLFGLLAVEIAVSAADVAMYLGVGFFIVGLFFVVRSFYGMRITQDSIAEQKAKRAGGGNKPAHLTV